MVFDLVAGARQRFTVRSAAETEAAAARILVFDSGLGGLTVFPEIRDACPGAALVYAADDAVFPYGRLDEATLVERVTGVMAALIAEHRPDLVVVACHTASTLVLGPLRARWPGIGFVGTVPAIKPAAEASASRMISVLATPGTVAREYTRDLVKAYAGDCAVSPGRRRRARQPGRSGHAGRAAGRSRHRTRDRARLLQRRRPAHRCGGSGLHAFSAPAAASPGPGALVRHLDRSGACNRPACRAHGGGERLDGAARGGTSTLTPAVFTSNAPPRPALAAFLATRGVKWQASPALSRLDGSDTAV